MAWIDDRIWCHPKFTDLTPAAFKLYVCGLAYSSGLSTKGVLTAGQQQTIGAKRKTRQELVDAGLWNVDLDGKTVAVNDWEEYNSKRDERRERDRERKREARASGRWNEADRGGLGRAPSTAPACVDGSEGSDGSEEKPSPRTLVLSPTEARTPLEGLMNLAKSSGDGEKMRRATKGQSEAALASALELATMPGARDPLAVALSELGKARKEKAA